MKRIPVRHRNKSPLWATVDDDDYGYLSRFKWFTSRRYVFRVVSRKITKLKTNTTVLMHREVMNAPPHLEVDHINGNTRDNRKRNLRLATRGQNASNNKRPRTRYGRHITKTDSPLNPYRVKAYLNNKGVNGGCHPTLKAARSAAKKLRERIGHWGS